MLVAGEETLCGRRIELRQPLAKRRPTQPPMKADRFLSDLLGNFRHGRQSLLQCAEIEAGAADENGKAARLCRIREFPERERAPPCRGTALAGVEKTVEPVRCPLLRRLVGPRRQDAEIAITLQAVGIDNDAAEAVRQFERERRFAARCRTRYDKDRGRVSGLSTSRVVRGAIGGIERRPMDTVLTLIARPHGASDLAHLVAAIVDATGTPAEPVWLSPGEACDLVFDPGRFIGLEQTVRSLIGNADIDLLLQPLAGRRKRLLVADMEATIIENEMLDELADALDLGPAIPEITRRAMNGEIDFAAALEARVALLAGTEARALEEVATRIRLAPGARELIATMRAAGAVTVLVSGGFGIFAKRVAAELSFDRVVANRLDIAAGRIVGTVQPPIVTGETKRRTLLTLAAGLGLSPDQTMAVGDGANDLPMLTAAGIGIAFRAKPQVAARVRFRIDHADLTGLLFIQGYRRDEIVADNLA